MKRLRQMKLASLLDQHPQNVILEGSIFLFARNAAGMILAENGFGFLTWRFGKVQQAEIRGLKFHGPAALLLIVGAGLANESFVAGKLPGERAEALLFFVALQDFFLKRYIST